MMNLFENLQLIHESEKLTESKDFLEDSQMEEIEEMVLDGFETGHMPFDDFEEFKLDYMDEENVELAWSYYEDLINMGPVGFYEEFHDKLNFSDEFKNEYGFYDEDEYDELDESSKQLKENQELYNLPNETQVAILSDFDSDKPIYQADGTDSIKFAIESAIWQAVKSINVNNEEIVINISKRKKTSIDDEGNIL